MSIPQNLTQAERRLSDPIGIGIPSDANPTDLRILPESPSVLFEPTQREIEAKAIQSIRL